VASITLGSFRAGGCPTPDTITWSMCGMSSIVCKNGSSLRTHDCSPRTAHKRTFFRVRKGDHRSVERHWVVANTLTILRSQSKRSFPFGASR